MGKTGLRQVAELCWHKSHYAAKEISALPGYEVDLTRPFIKEFVVRCPQPVSEINRHLYDEHGIIGGYDLGQDYAHLEDHMLVCVTEMNSRDDIDTLVHALSEFGE
jgi:glycine dehydrogenase subunit 1